MLGHEDARYTLFPHILDDKRHDLRNRIYSGVDRSRTTFFLQIADPCDMPGTGVKEKKKLNKANLDPGGNSHLSREDRSSSKDSLEERQREAGDQRVGSGLDPARAQQVLPKRQLLF